MRHNEKRLLGALAILLVPGLVAAQLGDVATDSQETILVAQADGADPARDYAALLKEISGLEVYNALLERQIQAQQLDISNLRVAIDQVPDLERQISPLLIRMVAGLEDFVRLDIPFLPEERSDRVADLQLYVERADVSEAEKFRRILEAWQIETEYGSGFTTYVGQLNIDGESREVDFLQIGRIGLLYQTTDEDLITGAWDPRNNAWIALGSRHRNSVRQALRMARNQIAPELVILPMMPPQ